MYWPIFWLHIVNLCKIPFHLIGHTIWFNFKIKFPFFEPPLLFCNGDSKNENLNFLQKYGVRPIKWKGILHRLTIWSQILGQYNSVESSLKMGLNFFQFEDYLKSARWMILFRLVTCYHTPTLHENTEKPTVIWFYTQILIESTVSAILLPSSSALMLKEKYNFQILGSILEHQNWQEYRKTKI